MTGPRNTGIRIFPASILIICLLGTLIAVFGCGEDTPTDVEFPDPLVPPTPYWLYSVWGRGADDIYIAGQPGLILHYDGDAWETQNSGNEEKLIDVYGLADGPTYICGHNGTLLVNNGGGWSAMDSGVEENLFAVGEYLDDIYACGLNGTIRRLNGSNWVSTDLDIIGRDDSGTVIVDTLYLDEDVKSLTTIFHYGIGGSDGLIITDDVVEGSPYGWMKRVVTGGLDWITASWSSNRVGSNFWATDSGKLFQLYFTNDGMFGWHELYSPSDRGIYGMWVNYYEDINGLDHWDLFMVSVAGEILHETIIDENAEELYASLEVMHDAGTWLFDIWGYVENPGENDPDAILYNLYAVGLDGTVLHYYDPDPEDDTVLRQWYAESVGLPDSGKALPATDKFGRAF